MKSEQVEINPFVISVVILISLGILLLFTYSVVKAVCVNISRDLERH